MQLSDIIIVNIGSTCKGASALKVNQITADNKLRNKILALSCAQSIPEVANSQVSEFFHVKEIDVTKNEIRMTGPKEDLKDNKILVVGSLEW